MGTREVFSKRRIAAPRKVPKRARADVIWSWELPAARREPPNVAGQCPGVGVSGQRRAPRGVGLGPPELSVASPTAVVCGAQRRGVSSRRLAGDAATHPRTHANELREIPREAQRRRYAHSCQPHTSAGPRRSTRWSRDHAGASSIGDSTLCGRHRRGAADTASAFPRARPLTPGRAPVVAHGSAHPPARNREANGINTSVQLPQNTAPRANYGNSKADSKCGNNNNSRLRT